MTDRIALVLGAMILAAIGADQLFNNGDATLFMLRKFADFIDVIAVWR